MLTRNELIERHSESYLVSSAMLTYGGGFARALAAMIQIADLDNMQKIKDTWPEYWNQYLDMHVSFYSREGRVL